ncbi:hypothetical protein ROZALSC1DRAFT_31504, partial [Rozella allomycis CSF55]
STIRSEINSIILDYLQAKDFFNSLKSFNEELHNHKEQISFPSTLNDLLNEKDLAKDEDTVKDIVMAFEHGNVNSFLKHWGDLINRRASESDQSLKLEFFCRIYFVVCARNDQECHDSIEILKQYLDIKGTLLSKNIEFLPYFALPYIPNPSKHPNFSTFYSTSLKHELMTYLDSIVSGKKEPLLFHLYKDYILKRETLKNLNSCHIINNDSIIVRRLQDELDHYEDKDLKLVREIENLKRNYSNLLKVATELVEVLMDSVNGQRVDTDKIEIICQKLIRFKNVSNENIETNENIKSGVDNTIYAEKANNSLVYERQEHQDLPDIPTRPITALWGSIPIDYANFKDFASLEMGMLELT